MPEFPEGIHPFTIRWWEGLPQTYRKYDMTLGFPLLRYMDGMGSVAGDVEDISYDMYDGTLMDPSSTPERALRWLSMLMGLPVAQRAATPEVLRETLVGIVENGRPPVGTRQGIAEAIKTFLVGGKQVYVVPTPGRPYVISVLVRLDEVPGAGGSGPQWPWTSPVVDWNYVLDPSFEAGTTTGWTKPAGSVLQSITHAPGEGVDGGAAVKLLASGTVGDQQGNVAFFALPDDVIPGMVSVKVRCATPPANTFSVYGSVMNYAADGTFLDEAWVSEATVGMGRGYQLMYVDVPWQAAFNPEGVVRYLKIAVGDYGYNQPHLEDAEVFVDQLSLTSDAQAYFDGSTAPAGEYSYQWDGPPNASFSKKLTTKQVSVPPVITMGEDFMVWGRGYEPGDTVTLEEWEWSSGSTEALVDAEGNFTATMNIPRNTDPEVGPVPGPGTLYIGPGWPQQSLFPAVTFV